MSSSSSRDGEDLILPALGRNACLGYLYDQRRDEFRSFSIFKRPISNEAITTIETPKTLLEASIANTYEEKFRLFNIEASIKANILSGMLKVEGSASYLQDEKQTGHEVTGLMHFECHTVEEKLQLYYEGLKDFYNTDVLYQDGATHIVTGIKWGANVAIKFTDTIDKKEDHQKICGELRIEFDKIKAISISASAKVDIDGKDNSKKIKSNVSVRGDILLPDTVPSTNSQVIELISKVPQLAQTKNNGKGVPIRFELTPLGPLRKYLELTTKQNEFCKKLDNSLLDDFVIIFDEISYAEQELNDANKELLENPICVSRPNRDSMVLLRGKFMKSKTGFSTSFKETFVQVRVGDKPESALSDLTKAYEADEYGAYRIQPKIRDFDNAIRKVELYKAIQKSNKDIKYFGLKGNLESHFLGNIKDVVYILYTKPEFTKNEPTEYEDCTNLFFTKLEKPFNKRYVVDCDFDYPQASLIHRTVIHQRVNGKVNIEDVNDAIKKTLPSKILKMRALGRFAQMGQLYDARENVFLDESFLTDGYKKDSIVKVTCGFGKYARYLVRKNPRQV